MEGRIPFFDEIILAVQMFMTGINDVLTLSNPYLDNNDICLLLIDNEIVHEDRYLVKMNLLSASLARCCLYLR